MHIFWALLRCRVASGGPLFAAVNRRNFNSSLKAVMEQLCVPDAQRYSPHGFRRWTTQDLKGTGSHRSVVATLGLWNSPAFRGYVDMPREVEIGAQQLFEVDMDSTSEQEKWPAYDSLGTNF